MKKTKQEMIDELKHLNPLRSNASWNRTSIFEIRELYNDFKTSKELHCLKCKKIVHCTIGGFCDECYPIELQKAKDNFKPHLELCRDCDNTVHIKRYNQINLCPACMYASEEADRQADKMEAEVSKLSKFMQSLMIDDWVDSQ